MLSNTKSIYALDCEMVGVGGKGLYSTKFWKNGTVEHSILARVSIVNQDGTCIYDKYVKPTQYVTDYRTECSGICQKDMENGEEFLKVKYEVADILRGNILVGHALGNDLAALHLKHPPHLTRDTALYPPCTLDPMTGKNPRLKDLASRHLQLSIQVGQHNSIEDAQVAMQLYKKFKYQWEKDAPFQETLKISVPKQKHGFIIGRGGSNLGTIQKESRAIINFDDTFGPIITITGIGKDSVTAAKNRIISLTQ